MNEVVPGHSNNAEMDPADLIHASAKSSGYDEHTRCQDLIWGEPKPQVTCNDFIRNFRKEGLLMDSVE